MNPERYCPHCSEQEAEPNQWGFTQPDGTRVHLPCGGESTRLMVRQLLAIERIADALEELSIAVSLRDIPA